MRAKEHWKTILYCPIFKSDIKIYSFRFIYSQPCSELKCLSPSQGKNKLNVAIYLSFNVNSCKEVDKLVECTIIIR